MQAVLHCLNKKHWHSILNSFVRLWKIAYLTISLQLILSIVSDESLRGNYRRLHVIQTFILFRLQMTRPKSTTVRQTAGFKIAILFSLMS